MQPPLYYSIPHLSVKLVWGTFEEVTLGELAGAAEGEGFDIAEVVDLPHD